MTPRETDLQRGSTLPKITWLLGGGSGLELLLSEVVFAVRWICFIDTQSVKSQKSKQSGRNPRCEVGGNGLGPTKISYCSQTQVHNALYSESVPFPVPVGIWPTRPHSFMDFSDVCVTFSESKNASGQGLGYALCQANNNDK